MKPKCSRIRDSFGLNMLKYYIVVLYIGVELPALVTATKVIEEFACFNTLFEISCQANEVIVFDTARYGRDDAAVAARCQVPYQRNCDVDVHFPLNRVCAGKQKCSLAVNTALFGDPCGYEEFLRVAYRCVAVATVQQVCYGENGPTFYDHGFIASPNYPTKYYMDADCHWKLSVQKRQGITITILDFELDVKKAGTCSDYLEIRAGERVYFKDCGSLGKQVIQIDSPKALVNFRTGHGSLAQRGFLIYFEAHGPGCPDLEDLEHGWADYYIEQDVLYANVSCKDGFHFSGTDTSHDLIQCSGHYWNTILTPCIPSIPPTTPIIVVTSVDQRNHTSVITDSGSVIGIALGVVSAILLITLLLVLALYFHKRRRNAERKLDQWRFVINNLQENSINEENLKRSTLDTSGVNIMSTPMSNVRKAPGKRMPKKNQKVNNKEDEWQGRNLLTSPNYDEDEMLDIMTLDARDAKTMIKFPMPTPEREEEALRQQYLMRKNSKSGRFSLARSRDSQLENSAIWFDCDTREKPKPNRKEQRVKRAKSGQWEAPNKSFTVAASHHHQAYPPTSGGLHKKQFTQSAPDLLQVEMGVPPAGNGDIFCCHSGIYGGQGELTHPKVIGGGSTLNGVPIGAPVPVGIPGSRGPKPTVPPRTSSRSKFAKC